MTRSVRIGVASLAFGTLAWSSTGAAGQAAPQPLVPVVVELFTSEGCSSCPPADLLLTDLISRQPVTGAVIIGLSEHVDYWNQLGWKDPFSSAAFSKRQTDYASSLHTNDVYTPQMVVDGVDPFVGADRSAALEAIGRAAKAPKSLVKLGWTGRSPLTLAVSLDASVATADATLLLAVVEDGLASAVARGENEGRRLTHSAVTRRLVSLGKADHAGAFHAAPVITLEPSWKTAALRVLVLVQRHAGTAIVAAGTIGLS